MRSILKIVVRPQTPRGTPEKCRHRVRPRQHCQSQNAEFAGGADTRLALGSFNERRRRAETYMLGLLALEKTSQPGLFQDRGKQWR